MLLKKISTHVFMVLTLVLCGCGGGGEYRELGDKDNVKNTDPHDHHDHGAGPHGGHILEFGDYHGEITLEEGIVTVYVLGDDAETAVPVTGASAVLNYKQGGEGADLSLSLAASPLEGEAEGTASRFASTAGELAESIKDIEDLAGNVVLTIGDKTLKAEITHDHDHDHGHK